MIGSALVPFSFHSLGFAVVVCCLRFSLLLLLPNADQLEVLHPIHDSEMLACFKFIYKMQGFAFLFSLPIPSSSHDRRSASVMIVVILHKLQAQAKQCRNEEDKLPIIKPTPSPSRMT